MNKDRSIIQTEIQLINATAGLSKAVEVLAADLPLERKTKVFGHLGEALAGIQNALSHVQDRIKQMDSEQQEGDGSA